MWCFCKNTLSRTTNGRRFTDDIFNIIFLNETSLKLVSKGSIVNKAHLVHVMAWRRPGDKPLLEPMICAHRPQYVYLLNINLIPTIQLRQHRVSWMSKNIKCNTFTSAFNQYSLINNIRSVTTSHLSSDWNLWRGSSQKIYTIWWGEPQV